MICKSHNYTYICTHKKGLVAQLNSALDYGSRGYWFESSRGHLRMKSPHESVGFFCIKFDVELAHKIKFYTKKVSQSEIEEAFHFHYGAPLDVAKQNPVEKPFFI